MVNFADYMMPVNYPLGGLKEHLHCRKSVGLFDVSHMGQCRFKGKDASKLLERVTVVDTQNLQPGQGALSLLMLEDGGIQDDCIITKLAEDDFYVVLNAGCKFTDLEHIKNHQDAKWDVAIEYSEENSLIAIQGPWSQYLMEKVLDVQLGTMPFMTCTNDIKFDGAKLMFSRCGYTGEDGFEVSVPNDKVEHFMEALLERNHQSDGTQIAEPVGLGARDSLRLEAGLCLYGNDLCDKVSPIGSMLAWTISKRRREEGGFLGYDRVKKELAEGVARKRCGFIVEGKLPPREGAEIWDKNLEKQVGVVTSGVPGPTFG